jgi:hypothetical protein
MRRRVLSSPFDVELPVAIIRPPLLASGESMDERTVASRVSSIHAPLPKGHEASDPAERDRLKEELARMTFGA